MSNDAQNRQLIREEFSALLIADLEGAGKPAQKVYEFIPGDFGGKYSLVAVESRPSTRTKQAQVTRVASNIKLDVHTFVLYADHPILATNSVTAGNGKVILLPDTSLFEIGEDVCVTDGYNYDVATVTAIAENVSITVNLTHAFTSPKVYWWNEKLAVNRLDLLEKMITDVVMDNDTNDIWDELAFEGVPDSDPVVVGGKNYLHEVFHLNFQLKSD